MDHPARFTSTTVPRQSRRRLVAAYQSTSGLATVSAAYRSAHHQINLRFHLVGIYSFACIPTEGAPRNMEIRCAKATCAFTGTRSLPILTVDEVIYRRLPAFIIATVDKFAGLPWLGEAGAFFGHVDREDQWGFYGAADSHGTGMPLDGNATLMPPALIVQDELHLISGPLGTVAALYEVALDRLATRTWEGKEVRPKVVASTATVRRALLRGPAETTATVFSDAGGPLRAVRLPSQSNRVAVDHPMQIARRDPPREST
jgi:hypothetical protein